MKPGYALSKLRFKKTIDLTAAEDTASGESRQMFIDCADDVGDYLLPVAEFMKDHDLDVLEITNAEDCESYADVIRYALSILMQSPSAGALVRDAAASGWTVALQAQKRF
ncbi:MAG: hypothetical protein LRZ85_05420 [Alphaproteobacteria bacterium]|nr:hypothetical protein [Alphaproteobacteria bacterium]